MKENINAKALNTPGIIGGALVLLGIALWMFVSKGLLIVAGLGAFGPGVLREIGLLRDHDEFQRKSARRAGYHAYLIAGLAATSLVSFIEITDAEVGEASEWMNLLIVILWMSWMFSSVLAYWGAKKTASRMLIVFGLFWAVFVIADVIGEMNPEVGLIESIKGVLFGTALIAAFFVPAWTAQRWPRPTGVVLLLIAVALLTIFRGGNALSIATNVLTITLLICPLIVTGIALVFDNNAEKGEDAEFV
jgi:hypothetical protein